MSNSPYAIRRVLTVFLSLLMWLTSVVAHGKTQPTYGSDLSIIPELDIPVDSTTSVLNKLDKIEFRRTVQGYGRIILTLPRANTEVAITEQGSNLHIHVAAALIQQPKKRINVLDFATPVTFIEAQLQQQTTDITVYIQSNTQGKIRHTTQRNHLQYSITLAATVKKPLTAAHKKVPTFQGERLSLNFQDIEVRAVLQILADFTKKNIAVSDTVTGNITLNLTDIPWDHALDIILKTKNLALRKNNKVLWIAPAEEVAAKEQQALEVEQRKSELEPLITETLAINFAKAKDLAALLKESKGNSLLSKRGNVSLDQRTNTLLLQDVATQLQAIKRLIKTLDVPVKQVLIESRIVVANNDFSKDLGTKFGVTSVLSNNNNLLALSGSNEHLSVNLPVVGAAGSLGFSILSKGFLLDLELSALQAESKGEIIATPRIITLDQNTATIEQGIEIPYQQANAKGKNTTVAFKKAVLSMDVTPQITPNNHIVIDLKINQDNVGQIFNNVPSINTRAVRTKVLVENGQTIVLGGVHVESNLHASSKVPILGDIPVVGRLFRKTHRQDNKRELLIFVTPKIISGF